MNSQYNLLPYNAMQYNVTVAIEITIGHSLASSDVVAKDLSKPLVDSVVDVDVLSKQITDKRLVESVKMNEWFTAKNAPQSDPWS